MQLGIRKTHIEKEAGESKKIKQWVIKYKKSIPSIDTFGTIIAMFDNI